MRAMFQERTSSSGVTANDDVAQVVQGEFILVRRVRVRVVKHVARIASCAPEEIHMITVSGNRVRR